MSPSWKPDGYSTVSPDLVVNGAQEVLDFLAEAFDATPLRRYEADDGSIVHAEARVGDTVVMVGEAGDEWPARTAFLHVYVRDVDETYRRAIDAGGVAVEEPARREGDPDRRGGVRDPAGNTWWIATPVG